MRRIACLVGVTLAAWGACGNDDAQESRPTTVPELTTTTTAPACAAEMTEPLDPQSGRHVIPGTGEPQFQSDPPTSGPHVVSDLPSGVVRDPIPKAKQVGLLEAGKVILQHRGLSADDTAGIEGLASADDVVVAPAPDLPAPIVATAWTFKQTCQRFDAGTLSSFIAAHAGKVGTEH